MENKEKRTTANAKSVLSDHKQARPVGNRGGLKNQSEKREKKNQRRRSRSGPFRDAPSFLVPFHLCFCARVCVCVCVCYLINQWGAPESRHVLGCLVFFFVCFFCFVSVVSVHSIPMRSSVSVIFPNSGFTDFFACFFFTKISRRRSIFVSSMSGETR